MTHYETIMKFYLRIYRANVIEVIQNEHFVFMSKELNLYFKSQ